MITLPIALEKFMQGKDLKGLKPFALLYRNKWNAVSEKFELDSTPIDITALIAKPNTLSMTLDVNEVAQYNANNVTLTLEDTKNYFVEGTPNSYFPDGYQIYGSKVVLYYGLNTPINPYPTEVGYTVVGNPTITDGVASGFSSSNYLQISQTYNATNDKNVEIYVRAKTPTTISSSFNPIFGADNIGIWGISSYTNALFTIRMGYANGTSFTFGDMYISGGIQADTWYRFKITGRNGIWRAEIYDDNNNLLKSADKDWSSDTFSVNYTIKLKCTDNTGVYSGAIDLNNTYIKVNGEYWFNGAHFFWQNNSTPLFTGVIKEPPTHKPDKYQVDVKLVSPLEMLKDIEAKDFSDKVIGETLTYVEEDDDGHKVYQTTGTGVGGFDAVYADGVKLFEGVDYEVEQLNELVKPAIVTIINSAHYSATITADYYTWKRDLTVEQIVAGLVGLAGYNSGTEDIRNVVWNSLILNKFDYNAIAGLGYKNNNGILQTYYEPFYGEQAYRAIFAPNFFKISYDENDAYFRYSLGDTFAQKPGVYVPTNGLSIFADTSTVLGQLKVSWYVNGNIVRTDTLFNILPTSGFNIEIQRNGNIFTVNATGKDINNETVTSTTSYTRDFQILEECSLWGYNPISNYILTACNSSMEDIGSINTNFSILTELKSIGSDSILSDFNFVSTGTTPNYSLYYRFGNNKNSMSQWALTSNGADIGVTGSYFQFKIVISNQGSDINSLYANFLISTLTLQLVNLSNLTVLEALQDFALISGYEFGVDRQGVFFFRPRISSTTPIFELDHSQLEKVDTVKKNLSDFFTKLTLTFAQVPLEFYANTGERPTLVDKYGIINKEIDKPDIVNYDNPELAQAIGPQLLEVYSALPNIIQAVGKLNLALELGDIVNLKRNLNLIADPDWSDFSKYIRQQTYYRACKITGMNYNFAKRQITYTLRDVSNNNNYPPVDAYGFPYDLPIQLGKLKTE